MLGLLVLVEVSIMYDEKILIDIDYEIISWGLHSASYLVSSLIIYYVIFKITGLLGFGKRIDIR